MTKVKNKTKYNFLTIIDPSYKVINQRRYGLFQCDCGKQKVILKTSVTRGMTKSCGCLVVKKSKQQCGNRFKTHGRSKCSIYHSWSSIKQRCLDSEYKGYKDYGGRGIKVCDRWMKFENFLEDMGERPSKKHSIDRIDNNGNYEPSNCRWATKKEQALNRRSNLLITYKGKTQTLMEWSEELKIPYNPLRNRIKTHKWSIERSFTTDLTRKNYCKKD